MAEESNEEVKKSGGGKGLIIALIALVVILLLVVVGGGYFLYSQGVLNPNQNNQEQVQKQDGSKDTETFKADINDLVLNITNSKGREKLMKLSFSVKSSEPTIAALVEEYKAEIIDVVIAQISARNSDELLTVGGKNLLKDELIEDINKVLNEVTMTNSEIKQNSIQKVLFTSFVIK